jgi:hypothetical protein
MASLTLAEGIELFSAITAVAGATATVVSSNKQAANQRAQAKVANENAQAQIDAAKVKAMQIRRQTASQVGAANAQLAANGVSLSSGTPMLIDQDMYRRGAYDASMTVLNGGAAAISYENQAAALNASADNTADAGYINAGQRLGSALMAGLSVGAGSSTPATQSSVGDMQMSTSLGNGYGDAASGVGVGIGDEGAWAKMAW